MKGIRVFHHPLLLLGVVAVALFVVGPQWGSIDDDNDGNPDIAVLVSAPRRADVSRSRGKNETLQNLCRRVPADVEVDPNHLTFGKSDFLSHDERTAPHSFCVLRC